MDTLKKSKEDQIIWNIYVELFEKSEPKGDFEKMVEEAQLDEFGRKSIPFMDYTISEASFNEIISKNLKGSRLSNWKKDLIKRTVLLGCSPKFK